ncbi:DUF7146 domain-containing protein [Asticcacaulis taihuensis]|uniref:DUF7146 domain-containing protein n=1 Tax=Asticcacaulis taihuensis TaxID=260084 RepID=UPI0026EBD489|nr:toprim domain-containing protein [Asticcacaulis taihuensis]
MAGFSNRDLQLAEAKDKLALDVPKFIEYLGADWQKAGARFIFLQPPHAYNETSTWISLRDGSWKDEVGGHPSGIDRGDIIALIQRIAGKSFVDAKQIAFEYLGWTDTRTYTPPSPEQRAEYEAIKAARRREIQAERDQKSSKLFAYWRSLPPAQGTIAETYLREARRIPLDRLKPFSKTGFPHSLRFEAVSEHKDERTGELTDWPALVGLVSRGSQGIGLHRTWLKPDGSDKAPVDGPKKMFGQVAGGTIRLWFGQGDYRPSEARKRGLIVPGCLGEGIETVLSVVCAVPEWRGEAAGSLGNIGNFEWPDYYGDLTLLRENDQKPQAVAAFDKAIASAAARPRPGNLYEHAPDQGDDHNTYIRLDPDNIDRLREQLLSLKDC